MDPLMESGPFRYRCRHDWGALPPHLVWGKTHAVAVDARQRVYIAHTSCAASPCQDTVVVFDADGRFLSSWGAVHAGHAHGLLLHRDAAGGETLYLTDDRRGVFRYTLDGRELGHIGMPECYVRERLQFGPANVAVAPDGSLFLAEGYGSAYVLRFAPDGRLLQRFGGRGGRPADTNWAHGVFIAAEAGQPLLHVAVDEPSAIKRFTLDGEYHSDLPGVFLHPRNVYAGGELWAIPEMQGRLTLLNRRTGAMGHLGHWGRSMAEIFELRQGARETFPIGAFVSAHGAAFLPDGRLIVTEWVEVGRVNLLTPEA